MVRPTVDTDTSPEETSPPVDHFEHADDTAKMLLSDDYVRTQSGALSVFDTVTSDSLNALPSVWKTGLVHLISYVSRHGGVPATQSRSGSFAVGIWLNEQLRAPLSVTQRAALLAVPGVAFTPAARRDIRSRSMPREALWIREQRWAGRSWGELS